jgi:hypothetical protein
MPPVDTTKSFVTCAGEKIRDSTRRTGVLESNFLWRAAAGRYDQGGITPFIRAPAISGPMCSFARMMKANDNDADVPGKTHG